MILTEEVLREKPFTNMLLVQVMQLLLAGWQPLHREQNYQLLQLGIQLIQKKCVLSNNLPLQHIFLQKATTLDLA